MKIKTYLNEAKDPWQMTLAEYQKSQIGKVYHDFLGREQEVSGTDAERRVQGYVHKEIVLQAIKSGKKVPQKVLANYPDLKKEYNNAKTSAK